LGETVLNGEQVLSFAGFPALIDFQSEDWRILFQNLECDQEDFLAHEMSFRSPEYRWPRDSLHTWSRLWEYPYVIHHLEQIRQTKPTDGLLKVADIGSGVTFFPFSVARLGCDVTCIDVDPVCMHDIPIAARIINHMPGKISIGLMEGNRAPLDDESQDVVYCISVLEHIPSREEAIKDIARILKPGGKLILTVDIDLRGDSDLSVEGFNFLQTKLAATFKSVLPGRVLHPAALLTSENSPYPYVQNSPIALAKQLVKNAFDGRLIGGRVGVCVYLTVYGTVLEKK
jgi:2-polyprenyl-3-methyl-5-hydroxy-6-metoxy-1,4-benzoquinol methylase